MRFKSISQQILSVFVFVTASCFGLTGWFVNRYSSDIVTRRISEGDLYLTARIAQEVADEWASVDPILTILAGSYYLRQMEAAGAQEILDQYQAQFPMIIRSWVADLTGDQIARTGDEALVNVSGLWRFVIVKGGKQIVSDVFLEPATSVPMLNVSLPIESSGEVVGVLSTDINLQTILRSLNLFGSVGDDNLVVIDANGKVVAHSRIRQVPELDLSELPVVAAVLDGQEGALSGYSDEFGRPSLGSYSPIEELGWGVLIQRPLSDIDAALMPVRRTIGFATWGAILGAVLAGWFMARHLARPIVQLANASEGIARGDLSTFVDITASNEIGVLANSFNEMVLSLKQSRDELLLWGEELEQSERKYRTLTENVDVGIYRSSPGPEGKAIEINRAMLDIFGYKSKEEFLATNLSDLYQNPEDRQAYLAELDDYGSRANRELHLIKKDGTHFIASDSAKAIRDEAGNVQYYDGILEDITERKKNREQLQQNLKHLEVLRQIDLTISESLDIQTTIGVLLDQITQRLEFDAADILLFDAEQQLLRFAAGRGFETATLQYTKLKLGEGYAGQVALNQEAIFVPDLRKEPGSFTISPTFENEGFVAYNCVPLLVRGEVKGVIELFHRSEYEMDDKWQDFINMLATQAAIAVDNASLYKDLENYSADLEQAVVKATDELREAKERVETILNNSPDAILLLTNDGRIETANQAVEVLLGYSPSELDGAAVETLFDPAADLDIAADLVQLTIATKPKQREISAIRKDGSPFDAELILTPIKVGDATTAYVCTIRDVSAWTELQRMKDAFVSNVSHELRTPITALRLNYSLLRKVPDEPKYLDRFDREITRLSQMIEDLLRLSRLDQGQVKLNMEKVNLNDLLAEIVQDRVVLAESNKLELVFIRPEADIPAVQADANLLTQVLSVLLTNAISYSPAGGHIEVRAVQEERDGARWAGFHVRDDGLGISSTDLPRITERFYRGSVGRESGAAGTGLGLAIAFEIVKRHRGHIDVESQGIPGEGTTFTVWLPVADDITN